METLNIEAIVLSAACPPAPVLDEAVWDKWIAKGVAREVHIAEFRLKAVKCVSIAVLLVVAEVWSHLGVFDPVSRFAVALTAIVVMARGIKEKNPIAIVVFAALAVLYNPILQVFAFSGSWQRALVILSAIPFLISLGFQKKSSSTLRAATGSSLDELWQQTR